MIDSDSYYLSFCTNNKIPNKISSTQNNKSKNVK